MARSRSRHHWGVVVAGVLVMAFGVAGASLPASSQDKPPAVTSPR